MPRYIPPREALGEYMNSPSGLAFVRDFLVSNGAELLDDLLDNATLQYVGARWQEKLLAAFRKRGTQRRYWNEYLGAYDFIDQ